MKKEIAALANGALRPLGIQITRVRSLERAWDSEFSQWIAQARAAGTDPNDVGDLAWNDDPLQESLERHYLPYIRPDSVVLELGPGTGRLTRHIIARCQEMVLVDYSALVCAWLTDYLHGKGRYRVYEIDKPSLSMISRESVDVILANGVFEHIDMDDMFCFLEEFHRVLRPGGITSFDFNNIMSEEGMQWFRRWRRRPRFFRFYHPDLVRHLAQCVGFHTLKLTASQSRLAYIELQKDHSTISQGVLPLAIGDRPDERSS